MSIFNSLSGNPGFLTSQISPIQYQQLNMEPLAKMLATKEAYKQKALEMNTKAEEDLAAKMDKIKPIGYAEDWKQNVQIPMEQAKQDYDKLVNAGYDPIHIIQGKVNDSTLGINSKDVMSRMNIAGDTQLKLEERKKSKETVEKNIADDKSADNAALINPDMLLAPQGKVITEQSYHDLQAHSLPATNKTNFDYIKGNLDDSFWKPINSIKLGHDSGEGVNISNVTGLGTALAVLKTNSIKGNSNQIDDAVNAVLKYMPEDMKAATTRDFAKEFYDQNGNVKAKYINNKTGELNKEKYSDDLNNHRKKMLKDAFNPQRITEIGTSVSQISGQGVGASKSDIIEYVPEWKAKINGGIGGVPYTVNDQQNDGKLQTKLVSDSKSNPYNIKTDSQTGMPIGQEFVADAGKIGVVGGTAIDVSTIHGAKVVGSSNDLSILENIKLSKNENGQVTKYPVPGAATALRKTTIEMPLTSENSAFFDSFKLPYMTDPKSGKGLGTDKAEAIRLLNKDLESDKDFINVFVRLRKDPINNSISDKDLRASAIIELGKQKNVIPKQPNITYEPVFTQEGNQRITEFGNNYEIDTDKFSVNQLKKLGVINPDDDWYSMRDQKFIKINVDIANPEFFTDNIDNVRADIYLQTLTKQVGETGLNKNSNEINQSYVDFGTVKKVGVKHVQGGIKHR